MNVRPLRLVLIVSSLAWPSLGATLHAENAPAAAAPAVDPDLYGDAVLREGAPPAYPAEALKQKIGGVVDVRFIVDATGAVTSARVLQPVDPRLDAAALAAVKAWKFAPAIARGVEVATCLETSLRFSAEHPRDPRKDRELAPDEAPRVAATTQPAPKTTPPGHYPDVLTERKLSGLARFSCRVTPEGRAIDAKILAASHADLVLPALASLHEWEFTPGMQGDLPVAAELSGEMTFDSLGSGPDEVLAANGITAPDGTPPPVAPEFRFFADPIWPLDKLLAGQTGSAAAEFTVSESGLVRDIAVRDGSDPEFARALVAALETWIFSRTFSNGKVVSVRLLAKFAPTLPDPASAADPTGRLVAALKADAIGGAKGLDARLTPIFQMRPEYPAALKGAAAPAGKAVIEFVIDREGRARLPRVVSATQDEFGWAAATALSQWVFLPPLRGGQPVDVKVRVPFDFAAPVE